MTRTAGRVRSQGVELELVGEILPGWSVNAGYTQLAIHDEAGEAVRRFKEKEPPLFQWPAALGD